MKSCELTKQAVSNLMYQLPIHGYVSVNMEAITVLNDQVGGVTVPVIDEFLVQVNPGWELGKPVTLMGEVRQGEVYEEFYADEKALKEMLVEIFCLPAEE